MQAQGRRTQPEVTASTPTTDAGASYRFLVRSAEEAVGTIRNQLGGEARVISVRSVKAAGVAGLLGSTRLEVIAQVPAVRTDAPVEAPSKPTRIEVVTTAAPTVPRNFSPTTAASEYTAASVAAVAAQPPPRPRGRLGDYGEGGEGANGNRLESLLRRSGLSESLIARLQSDAAWAQAASLPLHQGLSAMAGQIRELGTAVVRRPLASRAAFLGLPGVGCTTALSKWLAAEVFTRGRRGAVASIEFDRPKSADDLAVFAELLGVGFSRQAPADTANGEFCYLDVPAISLTRTEENLRLKSFLDEQRIPGRVLVVSGLHDAAVLRQACSVGVDLGCTHIVFTQLDELPQWGKLWDFLIDAPLVPLLLTLGPSLTGACETDVVGAVLRRTYPWD